MCPLQWVHGPRTVVMRDTETWPTKTPISPSMGPRSENRGYDARFLAHSLSRWPLQWVHGPRTVVMPRVWKLLDFRALSTSFREDSEIELG